MFDEFGFKMTMYPVINWGPNWPAMQKAAEQGHEIGSQPCDDRMSRFFDSDRSEVYGQDIKSGFRAPVG